MMPGNRNPVPRIANVALGAVWGLLSALLFAPAMNAQCTAQVSATLSGQSVLVHATGTSSSTSFVREIAIFLDDHLTGTPQCFTGTTCTVDMTLGTACMRDGSHTVRAEARCAGGTNGAASASFSLNEPPSVEIIAQGLNAGGGADFQIKYDFRRGTGNLSWAIETPGGGSSGVNPVISEPSGSYDWHVATACWPAGSYTVTATITRCSGEQKVVEYELVVPPHVPSVQLSLLAEDNSKGRVSWSFPQTSGDHQRNVRVELEPGGTAVYQSGVFVAQVGEAIFNLPACTAGSQSLRARALACGDLEGGLATTTMPLMLPKCEAQCCSAGEPGNCVGDPIRVTSGNMKMSDRDPLPGRLLAPLQRTYDSRNTGRTFGRGWSSVFDAWLVGNGIRDVLDRVHVQSETGERFIFVREAGAYRQVWPVPDRAPGSLVLDPSGDFLQRDPGSTIVRVFRGGKLAALRTAGTGHEISIVRDANGRPSSVADSWGSWSWTIATDANGRIASISVDGRPDLQWVYTRNGSGDLTGVATPAGVWRTYTYGIGGMATARDGAGQLIESHIYDTSGQALTSSGEAGEITNISYGLPGREPGEWRTHVAHASGRTTDFYSRHIAGSMRTVQIDGSCDCGSEDNVFVYDAAGHLVREQDALGYVRERLYVLDLLSAETTHLRPASCNPETDPQRCRMTPGTLSSIALVATDASRTISYEYGVPTWPDRVTRTTTASVSKASAVRQETFTYDALSGGMTAQSVTGWTESPVRQETHTTATALYNGTEGAAFNPGPWFPQAWRTKPQPLKQQKSVNGPRPGAADTTTFVYYPVDSSVPATWRGRLAARRTPAGQISRFENYDVFGNATRIVDPNGVATESTYDSLGRLVATTLKGVAGCDSAADPLCGSDITTTRVYAGNGPLSAEVGEQSVTSYTYDDRGRLLTISRGPAAQDLRERIESSYDPVTGKKAQERVLAFENGSWIEKKRESYLYDASEHLSRITHTDGASVEYTYGPGAQLVAVRNENHTQPNTRYEYDPAGRVKKVNQTLSTAAGGSIRTSYGYDRDGNLTSVTDPNGNATTYRYDDFGMLLEQVSPVTGTTRYKYDAAGLLLEVTQADGSVTTRTYDPLGRVLTATSTLNERSETIAWTYDGGVFGLGRLSTMTDPTGSTGYVYDRRGLLLSETKTIGAATYTSSFRHDKDGNRSRITYPGGRVVDYGFDYGSRPVSAATGPTPLVVSASYLPFGPLREVVFGNGATRSMTYDQRYRLLTNRLSGPLVSGEETSGVIASYEYTHDSAGNMTRIADLTNPAFERNFGYDDLHRLTTANGGPDLWGAGSYTYDAMGNLRTSAAGENLRTFTMTGTTPKIASVVNDGRVENVSYDPNGNETAAGVQTFTYTPRNLLRTAGDRIFGYDGRGIRTTTLYTVTLAAFSLDVATASPNQAVTGTVSLSAIAPAGGIAVRLRSSSGSLSIPAEVAVAPGQASATFTMTVATDAEPGTIALTATYATTLEASLIVTDSPALSAFTANPSPVTAGSRIMAEVTLAGPAPEGGAVVAITADREAIANGTITIDAEETSGSTLLETYEVSSTTTVLLRASYGGATLETSVQVQPATPATDRLVIEPDGVVGGEGANGTVHLLDPLPAGGRTFQLTSSHPAVAAVPASIHIGGDDCDGGDGSGECSSATFPITTSPVTTETQVTITATDGTVTLTAVLTVVCPTGPTPTPSFPPGQTVFIDDVLPSGAAMSGALRWDQSQKASGDFALVAPYAGSGIYQATITGLTEPLAANHKLFVYARIADCAVPRQIVLRARVAGQWASAYWGQPLWGVTGESINMGAVPANGTWQRLELLLRNLGEGEGGDPMVTDFELVHVDGQVWFDRIGHTADCIAGRAGQPSVPTDEDVLIDDDVPSGVTFESASNAPLEWSSAQAASGALSLAHPYRGQGTYVTGVANLAQPLVAGSKLSLYALIDSCSPPVRQIHLRITTTGGSGTVSWGEPVWDVDESTLDRGSVPTAGTWTRLEVPLDALELDNGTLTRIDIAHVDGRVWFDRIALWPVGGARLTSFASDHESTVSVGTTVTWTATASGTVQPLQYRFERRDDLGNWSIVQNYGVANTYTWTPTAADVGTNAVRVSVRNGGSMADFEDTASLLVRVVEGEEGYWLHQATERFAWWTRWFEPRVPVSLGVDSGSITTTAEGAPGRHSLYTPELQLLAETEITNATSPEIAYEYIWFAGQPLAQITTSTGAIEWYFNDHLGTPILQTDAAANVTWRVEYDPYGNVVRYRTGTTKHQPLRFPGQENDGGSDLSYNVFRWYRSGWGRYTQSDPAWSPWRIDDLNPFSYAGASPVVLYDPTGLMSIDKGKCQCLQQQYQKNSPLESDWSILGTAITMACLHIDKVITDPKLAKCMKKKCQTGKVTCSQQCNDAGMYTFKGSNTIYVCVNNWPDWQVSSLEQGITHELAHTCGWDHGQGKGVPANSGGWD